MNVDPALDFVFFFSPDRTCIYRSIELGNDVLSIFIDGVLADIGPLDESPVVEIEASLA